MQRRLPILIAMVSIALHIAVIAPVQAQDRTAWKNDDCSTSVHRERGFTWYEHFGDGYSEKCYGTDGRDVFKMGAGDDWVRSFGGQDEIQLRHGADVAFSGGGDDYIYGGPERDFLAGGAGDDHLYDQGEREERDWDCLAGGAGTDTTDLRDNDGMDVYWAGEGWDPYPQHDVGGDGADQGVTDDEVYQAEDGPCRDGCPAPYPSRDCLREQH